MAGDVRSVESRERAHFRVDGAHAMPSASSPLTAPASSLARPAASLTARSAAISLFRQTSGIFRFRLSHADALIREWEYGTFYLFVPVVFGFGAALYFAAPAEPDLSAIMAGLVVLLLFARLARGRFALRIAVLAAVTLVAGMLAAKLEATRGSAVTTGSTVTTEVTGTLVLLQRQSSGRMRMVIDVATTARPRLKYQPVRIRVTAGSVPEDAVAGDAIKGRVRLLPPSGPVRPGGYDFSFESFFDGVGATGFFLGRPQISKPRHPTTWSARARVLLERARAGLTSRIKERIGGEEGNVAAALVTGDKGAISADVEEALRATGLAHILSISGLHMALVAGSVAGFLRAMFALFPEFASRHASRKYSASAALLAVFAYLFISGAGIATQRSFIMLAVMLVAMLFDRAALTMRNLATAALVVLALQPHEIAGPGFQMSFAATAALVSAYAAWSRIRARALARTEQRQPGFAWLLARYAGALVFTSLVAGAATTIYGIYHFQRVAPLGVIANLGAMPVVSLIVMPAAVAAHVLMPFDLDGPFFRLMGWGIGVVLAIARQVAARSPIDLVPAMALPAMLALSAGLIGATLISGRLRLVALPLFAAGAILAFNNRHPTILVSEDARLVAVDLGDGRMAVNRQRPNSFVMENWLRASAARTVIKPVDITRQYAGNTGADFHESEPDHVREGASGNHAKGRDAGSNRSAGAQGTNRRQSKIGSRPPPRNSQRPGAGAATPAVTALLEAIAAAGKKAAGFGCIDDICLARDASGALIATAKDAAHAEPLCAYASLIVIADATAGRICGSRQPVTVITARDLARRGSAAVRFITPPKSPRQYGLSAPGSANSTGPPDADVAAPDIPKAVVSYAIAEPYRPWHTHRAFSREARGLPPWEPRKAFRSAKEKQTPPSAQNR